MDGFLPETKNLKKVLTPGPAAGRGKWRLLASRNNTSPSSGRMLSEGNVFQTIRKNGINKEFRKYGTPDGRSAEAAVAIAVYPGKQIGSCCFCLRHCTVSFLSFLIFRADRHIPPHSFLSGRFRDTAGAFRRPASRKKPQTHKSAAGPEPLRTDSYRKSCKPPDAESGARQHEANLRQSAGNQSQKRYIRVYARKRQEP